MKTLQDKINEDNARKREEIAARKAAREALNGADDSETPSTPNARTLGARSSTRTRRSNGYCEDAPCCGCCGPQGDGDYYGANYGGDY